MGAVQWIIVTNYNEFRLYNYSTKTRYLSLRISEIEDESDLRIFKGVFSFGKLIEKNLVGEILERTVYVEQDVTARFYDFYHEIRLMILTEFELLGKDREEALNIAQTFLNRILFTCFAEDSSRALLPTQTLEKRLLIPLANRQVDIDGIALWETLLSLFNDLRTGSEIRGITKFNGGLFEEELPQQGIRDLIKSQSEFDSVKIDHGFEIPSQIKQRIDRDILDKLHPVYRSLIILATFDFESEISVNVLGRVFEQSISDLENLLSNDDEARVSRRKRQGIYYTPETVTHFIVERSLLQYLSHNKDKPAPDIGTLLSEWKDNLLDLRKKLESVKILDPACGSGAFLVACVDVLLEIHRAIHDERIAQGEFIEKSKFKGFKKESVTTLMQFFDDIEVQREIILNNIFGVDINPESVKITKLSLYLKIASSKIALPSLEESIKVGNSLIWDKNATDLAFDWEVGFQDIVRFRNNRKEQMETFGFDIIVGNPPYIRVQFIPHSETDFYLDFYQSAKGKFDASVLFFELALSLLSTEGVCTFISSKQFTTAAYGKGLRKILSDHRLLFLVDFGEYRVFPDAMTYTAIFSIIKGKPDEFLCFDGGMHLGKTPINVIDFFNNYYNASASSVSQDEWKLVPKTRLKILKKIENTAGVKQLNKIAELPYGVITGSDKVYVIENQEADKLKLEEGVTLPMLMGRDTDKWVSPQHSRVLIYPYQIDSTGSVKIISEDIMRKSYPNTLKYLKSKKNLLTSRKDSRRTKGSGGSWWSLMRRGTNPLSFLEEKLLVAGTVKRNKFFLGKKNLAYIGKGITCIYSRKVNQKFLLGILNSDIAEFYLHSIAPEKSGGYFTYSKAVVGRMPIVVPEESIMKEIIKHVSDIIKIEMKLKEEKRAFLDWIQSLYGKNGMSAMSKYTEISDDGLIEYIQKSIGEKKRSKFDTLLRETKDSIRKIRKFSKDIHSKELLINHSVSKIYEITEREQDYINKVVERERQ